MDDINDQPYNLGPKGKRVLEILADYLGAEVDDLSLGDSLSEDLHMKPTDLADFFNLVKEEGLEIGDNDITDLMILEDLVEAVEANNLSE